MSDRLQNITLSLFIPGDRLGRAGEADAGRGALITGLEDAIAAENNIAARAGLAAAFQIDGAMVDLPVMKRARQIFLRAGKERPSP